MRKISRNVVWDINYEIVLSSHVAFVILLAGYTIWPLYGVYKIGTVVQARNAAGLSELINFPRLRRSLAEQIVAEYLKVSGKTGNGGCCLFVLSISNGHSRNASPCERFASLSFLLPGP